jgi:hypothetical protein
MKKIINTLLDWQFPTWLLKLFFLFLFFLFMYAIGYFDYIAGYYQLFIDYHNNKP